MAKLKIEKNLTSRRSETYNGTNGRKYLTVHTTANYDTGADARVHGNLLKNGFSASWHYTVDGKRAVQSYPHTVRCWHAGDGKGDGNFNSIGIEICVNSDGNWKKAAKNAAKLVKKLMKEEGIPLSNVVQHNHWSGKDCPHEIRDGKGGVTWAKFKSWVDKDSGKSKEKAPKPPKKKNTNQLSVVDWMKAHGKNSSYSNRAKLAKNYGIKGYKGTAKQNSKLLSYLKGEKKPASKPKKPSSSSSSKSGKYGKLKITSKSGTAIVMASPDRVNAKNLGPVSGTVPLNGSVRGKHSSSGYWEIEYKGRLGYVTGKYGKRV